MHYSHASAHKTKSAFPTSPGECTGLFTPWDWWKVDLYIQFTPLSLNSRDQFTYTSTGAFLFFCFFFVSTRDNQSIARARACKREIAKILYDSYIFIFDVQRCREKEKKSTILFLSGRLLRLKLESWYYYVIIYIHRKLTQTKTADEWYIFSRAREVMYFERWTNMTIYCLYVFDAYLGVNTFL